MFISALRYWLLLAAMETQPLSILKKLGRLPNPKYGNVFDLFRKQPQQQQQQQQPQQQPQNNNNTNIKISSQEEVSPMADISATTTTTMTPATPTTITPLMTEDTGKILEKAICDVYGTPYDGEFMYSQEEVDKLIPRV
jgi:hypothetical protein